MPGATDVCVIWPCGLPFDKMRADPATSRGILETLIPYCEEKARAFEGLIKLSGSDTHLHRIAAAGLFRVPRCLRAVLLLADSSLSLEASTISRTLVELAIVACWIGDDEERGSLVWNRFVVDQHRGLMRLDEFYKFMKPSTKEERERLKAIPGRPGIGACAMQSVDVGDFPAQRVALFLHEVLYDSLSAGAHGDLRHAVSVVQWGGEDELVDEALMAAISASVSLLCVTSLQLGFRPDIEKFLAASNIQSPFAAV